MDETSKKHSLPVEDISVLLDTVGEKIPSLINNIKNTLFSADAGRDLGRAVGAFYKELLGAGIPSAEALVMAQAYLGTLQAALSSKSIALGAEGDCCGSGTGAGPFGHGPKGPER